MVCFQNIVLKAEIHHCSPHTIVKPGIINTRLHKVLNLYSAQELRNVALNSYYTQHYNLFHILQRI